MKNTNRTAVRFVRLGKAVVALAVFLCLETGAGITARAGELDVNYTKETSDFYELLDDSPGMKIVYDTLSSVRDESGCRVYSDEFVVGLMSNVFHEGCTGVVEYAFSKYHQYDFRLPSGGTRISTADDISYLMAWGTSNEGTEEGCAYRGSLGVSSLQWSYERREEYLEILLGVLNGKAFVSKEDTMRADAEMFLAELDPTVVEAGGGESLYNKITRCAEMHGGDAESYAEAICDLYVRPQGACLSMKESGDACKERRETASALWDMRLSKDTKVVPVSVSYVVNKQ